MSERYLARALQMGGVGADEVMRRHILHSLGCARHRFYNSKLVSVSSLARKRKRSGTKHRQDFNPQTLSLCCIARLQVYRPVGRLNAWLILRLKFHWVQSDGSILWIDNCLSQCPLGFWVRAEGSVLRVSLTGKAPTKTKTNLGIKGSFFVGGHFQRVRHKGRSKGVPDKSGQWNPGFFFFPVLWYSQIGIHEQQDLAKIDYIPNLKVEKCGNPFIV